MAYPYVIIGKIYSFKLKSNLQKLMQAEGSVLWISSTYHSNNIRVYLGVITCEVFLCFVAIVRVRVYYLDFFVLRHW